MRGGWLKSKVVRDLTRSCLMRAAELLMMTSYLGPDGSWSCVGIAHRAPHAFTCPRLAPHHQLDESGVSHDSD